MAIGADTGSKKFVALSLVIAIAFMAARTFRSWRSLNALLFLVILFIPIKRYDFRVQLPFALEPYRILVAFLVMLWVGALLVDPRMRLRRSGLEAPMIAWWLVVLLSISVNVGWIWSTGITVDVFKTLSFFLSFILVYLVISTSTRTSYDLDFLVKALVGAGAGVAGSAVVEYRTGYNVFNHLHQIFPILRYTNDLSLSEITRSDRLRVYASAQHPIALAAAMEMLIPLAVYLGLTTRRTRWWFAAFLLGMGSIATLSRTGVVMFAVTAIIFCRMRPADARRLAPLLIPGLLVVFLALPQALGTLKSAFLPKAGLIADQKTVGSVGDYNKSGRLVTLGPALRQWEKHPLLGQGYGTRIIDTADPQRTNANILDDQWLGSLVETGALGIGVLLWILIRSIRRLGRIARRVKSSEGLLAACLAASIGSFAVGAITYDAFSFIQVTFLFIILLALAGALLAINREESTRLDSLSSGSGA